MATTIESLPKNIQELCVPNSQIVKDLSKILNDIIRKNAVPPIEKITPPTETTKMVFVYKTDLNGWTQNGKENKLDIFKKVLNGWTIFYKQGGVRHEDTKEVLHGDLNNYITIYDLPTLLYSKRTIRVHFKVEEEKAINIIVLYNDKFKKSDEPCELNYKNIDSIEICKVNDANCSKLASYNVEKIEYYNENEPVQINNLKVKVGGPFELVSSRFLGRR